MKVLFTIIGIFFFTSASFAEEILISQETNQKNEIALLKLEQKANAIIQDAENKIETLEYKQKEIVLEKETLKNNTEREWNILSDRWAWADWLLSAVSLFLTAFGFVGWIKWKDITKSMKEAHEKAKKELTKVENTVKKADIVLQEINKKYKNLETDFIKNNGSKDNLSEKERETLHWLAENSENIKEKTGEDWFIIGLNYQNNENYEEAIKAYNKAIKINPKYYNAYNNLGVTYANQEKYEEAIEAYKKAIEINPKNDIAYYNLGNAYTNQEKYEEAIEAFEKAIKINPKFYLFYNNLARTYSLKKDNENAKKYLEETKKRMNPFNAEKFENDKDFDNLRKAEPEWWKDFVK